jgi:CheY-like chemotaxis protein
MWTGETSPFARLDRENLETIDVEWCPIMMAESGRYEHVLTAADGTDAIAMFELYETSRKQHGELFPPLLILLDINMPMMNGFEFLQRYQSLTETDERVPKTSVVLMLTSSAELKDKKTAKSFAAVKDYIVKPLTEECATQIAETYGEPSLVSVETRQYAVAVYTISGDRVAVSS